MPLEEYRRKRRFSRSPEPRGKSARRRGGEPCFVVQKHAASRLHYDFRLELGGVLKSWAVPKGPSLDPGERRLAVAVEDHPIEYGGFEGVIPEGEYGGGTVMLWDTGTWKAEGDAAEGYAKGHLRFTLAGKRLRGGWTLARMGGRHGGKNWLLIKRDDAAARPGSGASVVEQHQRSVLSRRTMTGIAKAQDRIWRSTRKRRNAPALALPDARAEMSPEGEAPDPARIEGARKAALPATIRPQLAQLSDTTPMGDAWLHEIKFDGYRMLARIARGKVAILSRNGRDWTPTFPTLAAVLARLPVSEAVLDGEVVHLEANGASSFSALKTDLSEERTENVVYFVFDLLHLDGYRLTAARLDARKAALASLLAQLPSDGPIRFSEHILGKGERFHAEACRLGLEGIVSKRRDAPYRPGRTDAWRKVKCAQRQEFVIIGWTDPGGQRTGFGSLLLGYYDQAGALRYAGRVGSGFDERTLGELAARFKSLRRADAPSKEAAAAVPQRTHWLKPELVAEIRFGEWTADRRLRHAVFLGLRDDKPAREVVEERGSSTAVGGLRPIVASDAAEIAGVRLSHPEKVLFPESGVTKLDLAHYYIAVAEHMLPHVVGRPLSLVRCPDGRDKQCFFQKHLGPGAPAALDSIALDEKDGVERYPIVRDVGGLVALVQMGVLEIHIWGSRAPRVEQPDRVVFDLDPDAGLPWDRVTTAALETRALLADIGLDSVALATGGKGLHVVAPIKPQLGWDEIKRFARAVADELVRRDPTAYTASLAKRARHGRIFVDYLRNQRGATGIAPYSVRARPGAPVAVPLAWKEVEHGIRSDQFTVASLPPRLAEPQHDPWRAVAALEQSLPATLRRKRRA
jgi:bifunctional non-homologous end joining protein LigD